MNALDEVAGETLASAVYEGVVEHRRLAPHPHAFHYPIAQLYLDLDEIDQVFARHACWSVNRANLAQFRRSDYLGDPQVPLAEAVRRTVEQATGEWLTGPIRMLTHLRYFGYVFNPLSVFWCHDRDGLLRCVVAEVHNTYGERHAYLLPPADLPVVTAKKFYVSPFNQVDGYYLVRAPLPDNEVDITVSLHRDQHRPAFVAEMRGERRPATTREVAIMQLVSPLAPLVVAARIRIQGIKLWSRRVPVVPR